MFELLTEKLEKGCVEERDILDAFYSAMIGIREGRLISDKDENRMAEVIRLGLLGTFDVGNAWDIFYPIHNSHVDLNIQVSHEVFDDTSSLISVKIESYRGFTRKSEIVNPCNMYIPILSAMLRIM